MSDDETRKMLRRTTAVPAWAWDMLTHHSRARARDWPHVWLPGHLSSESEVSAGGCQILPFRCSQTQSITPTPTTTRGLPPARARVRLGDRDFRYPVTAL